MALTERLTTRKQNAHVALTQGSRRARVAPIEIIVKYIKISIITKKNPHGVAGYQGQWKGRAGVWYERKRLRMEGLLLCAAR